MAVDDDRKLKEIKEALSLPLGGYSDHLATLNAFRSWQQSRQRNLFASQNFLSNDTLWIMEGLRKKILTELSLRGMPVDNNVCNKFASDPALVRSLLVFLISFVSFLEFEGLWFVSFCWISQKTRSNSNQRENGGYGRVVREHRFETC